MPDYKTVQGQSQFSCSQADQKQLKQALQTVLEIPNLPQKTSNAFNEILYSNTGFWKAMHRGINYEFTLNASGGELSPVQDVANTNACAFLYNSKSGKYKIPGFKIERSTTGGVIKVSISMQLSEEAKKIIRNSIEEEQRSPLQPRMNLFRLEPATIDAIDDNIPIPYVPYVKTQPKEQKLYLTLEEIKRMNAPKPVDYVSIQHGTRPGQKNAYGIPATVSDATSWKEELQIMKSPQGDFFTVRLPNSYIRNTPGNDAEKFIGYIDILLPAKATLNLLNSMVDEHGRISFKNVNFERNVLPLLTEAAVDIVLIVTTVGVGKLVKSGYKIGKIAAKDASKFFTNPEFRKTALRTFKKFDDISAEEASKIARSIAKEEKRTIRATTKTTNEAGNTVTTVTKAKKSGKFKTTTTVIEGATPTGTKIRPSTGSLIGKTLHWSLYGVAGAYSIYNISKAIEINPLFAKDGAPLPKWATEFATEHDLKSEDQTELRNMIFNYLKQDLAIFWAIWLSAPVAGNVVKTVAPKVFSVLEKAFIVARNSGKSALAKYLSKEAPQITKALSSSENPAEITSKLVDVIMTASKDLSKGASFAQYSQKVTSILATTVQVAVTAELFSEDILNLLGVVPVLTGETIELPIGNLTRKMGEFGNETLATADLYQASREQYSKFVSETAEELSKFDYPVYSSFGTELTDSSNRKQTIENRVGQVHEHVIDGTAFSVSFVLNVMYVDNQKMANDGEVSVQTANNISNVFSAFVPENDFTLKNLDITFTQSDYQKENLDKLYSRFNGKSAQFWKMIATTSDKIQDESSLENVVLSIASDDAAYIKIMGEFSASNILSLETRNREFEAMKIILANLLQGNIDFEKALKG